MKKWFFLIVSCALISISSARESKVNVPESESQSTEKSISVIFDRSEHDFGTITESGGIVKCEFTFKNAGEEPLVITKVTTSCGCTASEWSKEPVAAGNEGFIKVTFDPKGRIGDMTKSLVVFTNGNPESIRLKIKGNVK